MGSRTLGYDETHVGMSRNAIPGSGEYTPPRTIDWQPPCDHGDDVGSQAVPCVVLDPFAGSGTTLMVAEQLGRDSIGIELNPDYCEMAQRRIEGSLSLTRRPNREDPKAFRLELTD